MKSQISIVTQTQSPGVPFTELLRPDIFTNSYTPEHSVPRMPCESRFLGIITTCNCLVLSIVYPGYLRSTGVSCEIMNTPIKSVVHKINVSIWHINKTKNVIFVLGVSQIPSLTIFPFFKMYDVIYPEYEIFDWIM